MFTPWNSFSACLLAKNDRIGRARLDLVNQGHVNPLGLSSEFRIPSSEFGNAPCAMLATPLGLHAPYALCYAPCAMPYAHSFTHIWEVSFTCKGGCNVYPVEFFLRLPFS